MKYGERLKKARTMRGLSQAELAAKSGVKQGSISKIERGDQDASSFDIDLAMALKISPAWLSKGIGEMEFSADGNLPATKPESNAEFLGGFDVWDGNTPLNDDEVELPFFREVELSAGSGSWQVQENHGCKLRFAKSTLKKQGVQASNAYCVTVKGESMQPVLPNGSVVGVDISCTAITDGKMYALDCFGELRVKILYKLPNNGLRLRSYNPEYVDETYYGDDAQAIRILGKVFWYSVLL